MGFFGKKRFWYAAFLTLLFGAPASASGYYISGRVVEVRGTMAIPGASVFIEGTYLWAVSGQDGYFTIRDVPAGDYGLQVRSLGYVPATLPLTVGGNMDSLEVRLEASSLALDEVVVTAQAPKADMNTTLVIGSGALRHLQISNVSEIAALLPGGKTENPDLTSGNVFSLRDGGASYGNASFGTAVEVDGVRIGNNASFGSMNGVDTRNIPVDNIESVEVVMGVPSAEYGDLNSGMVRITTRKGYTPFNISASINPRMRQVAVSKGFDLGGDKGTINVNAEWTRAVQKLASPYTAYNRRGLSFSYSNAFRGNLKFEAGITGNIGGMNSEDDPDANTGEYTKVRDNVFRANTSLTWLVNKPWITNLKFDASLFYNDNRSHAHIFHSYASQQPSVSAAEQGYFIAGRLPYTFFTDGFDDSKELDYAASLKYEWTRVAGKVRSDVKAGVQWKATGNIGNGVTDRFRPTPYKSYPYMHNVSFYAEEKVSIPAGRTNVRLMAGLRVENLFIDGTKYKDLTSLSPRFNARWELSGRIAVRGGWGVTEKLPSYYVLYPRQEYRDVQTFGFSYNNNETSYVYHTQPYTMLHNGNLKWQRNNNSEVGIDLDIAGTKIFLAGYYNLTKLPYKYSDGYTPYTYNILQRPAGYTIPADPQVMVDSQTGMVYIRGNDNEYWTAMDVLVTDRTFVKSVSPDNGTDIKRKGIEMIVDFPEIKPVRTQIRLDAAYGYSKYVDNGLSYFYNTGWSHTTLPNRSYQYVGIYPNGGGSSTANGRRTQSLDANITAVTHIPSARIVVSCRLEMLLVKRSQNLSEYNGSQYAFNVSGDSNSPTGGSIYDGNSYTAIWPVAYVDIDGNVHPFTAAEAANPDFAHLIRKSGNAYTFARDGYDPYFSANLSVTKEIGDNVTLSFYANNFTNSRRYVKSHANGVNAIFIPDFYYGLSCRVKF